MYVMTYSSCAMFCRPDCRCVGVHITTSISSHWQECNITQVLGLLKWFLNLSAISHIREHYCPNRNPVLFMLLSQSTRTTSTQCPKPGHFENASRPLPPALSEPNRTWAKVKAMMSSILSQSLKIIIWATKHLINIFLVVEFTLWGKVAFIALAILDKMLVKSTLNVFKSIIKQPTYDCLAKSVHTFWSKVKQIILFKFE